MRSFASALVALAGVASVSAQGAVTSTIADVQSAPFILSTLSSNETLNGYGIYACHQGAITEGLCVATSQAHGAVSSRFFFNTTANSPTDTPGGQAGYLTYTLQGSNFVLSQPLYLYSLPTSNVALPLFGPGNDAVKVAFDEKNRLNIQSSIDDTVVPTSTNVTSAYYRFYSCRSNYLGYEYQTINWVFGAGQPQNPSCVKIDVVRHFA